MLTVSSETTRLHPKRIWFTTTAGVSTQITVNKSKWMRTAVIPTGGHRTCCSFPWYRTCHGTDPPTSVRFFTPGSEMSTRGQLPLLAASVFYKKTRHHITRIKQRRDTLHSTMCYNTRNKQTHRNRRPPSSSIGECFELSSVTRRLPSDKLHDTFSFLRSVWSLTIHRPIWSATIYQTSLSFFLCCGTLLKITIITYVINYASEDLSNT